MNILYFYEKNITGDLMYYSNMFFLFSILGFIIEKVLNISRDSGILYGFWTPIYGFGVCISIFIYNFFENKIKMTKFKKLIISFLIGFILLSLLEYIGGFLIERLLRVTFWDYSNEKYNIGKYTSLKMALIWGISSTVIIYIIKPLTKKWIYKIPKFITYILIVLYTIDSIITLSPYLIN